ATLLTDPNGAFSLSGLIPGTYRVVAAASGHATGQQLVEVGAGAPASVTLGLGPEVRLRGTARDATTGAALPGVTIFLTEEGTSTVDGEGALAAGVVTDSDGRYELGQLPQGSWTLTALHPEHETLVLRRVTLAGTSGLVDVGLSAPTIRVSGTVESDSRPLVGVSIIAADPSGVVLATATTARDG